MSELRIDLSDFGPANSGGESGGPQSGGDSRPRRGGWARRLKWAALLVPLYAVVPFTLLLRGSVHAHGAWGWGAWPAVGAGVVFASLSLGLLTWLGLTLLRIRGGFRRILSRAALFLAVAYAGYGLVYIAARNTKGDEVRAEYHALHPLLRLASTTLFLVDEQAVVTDASRTREDYLAMGLRPAEASLHFRQPSGFVHALDLRTNGRAEWRNRMVAFGFRAMGFRTLRHVGTADHLHISLPTN